MDTKDIDEAENLIQKYRRTMKAKEQIERIETDMHDLHSFSMTHVGTDIEVCLHGLQGDVLDAINGVLNEQHDKILARLREI